MDFQDTRRPSSSTSSITSTSTWASHDDPSPLATSRRSSLRFFTYLRQRQPSTTSTSSRTCEGMSTEETRELWRCMLELQQLYGCYNSTRIDLAVNAGEAGIDLMPNPFIIDTLNDSLVDLPEEGWDMLDRCLQTARKPSPRPKSKCQNKVWGA
ncbi:hypothetical protein VFPPC_03286 [Pochonia chlamydosporia 170]|uniref:Uncharacterized protein n=1 Tax=Pochonia chlamydosporia 170 TaxID=1380566 RepID=A0A179FYZ4_METCM|nr:hypothetical protein VFPPC_03286 [Pochonia chlamydosporia 170]OAQ70896.1 hypothetical protein VFPPC_03286 [Pochonia chlamydosporia 170]